MKEQKIEFKTDYGYIARGILRNGHIIAKTGLDLAILMKNRDKLEIVD